MSRTFKDAPATRRGRIARRFTDRETALGQRIAQAAPDDGHLWSVFADPASSGRSRLAAAVELGLTDLTDSEVFARAELTSIANGF